MFLSHTKYSFLLALFAVLLIACGGGNKGTDDDPGPRSPGNEGSPPVAHAGNHQTVRTTREVLLDGSQSSDIDDDELSYSWSIIEQPQGSAATLEDSNLERASFTPDISGQYEIQLIVNDGSSDSEPSNIQIVASHLPVAHAGSDQVVLIDNQTELSAELSEDIDNDALTYSWRLEQAPEGSSATLDNEDTAAPLFTPDRIGRYSFALVVNDGHFESTPDSVNINVTTQPQAHAGDDQVIEIDNEVQLSGSLSQDVDGDEIDYRWALVKKPERSLVNLENRDTLIDPSFQPDLPGEYLFQLMVNDGWVDSEPDSVVILVTMPVSSLVEGSSVAHLAESVPINGMLTFQFNKPIADNCAYALAVESGGEGVDITSTLSEDRQRLTIQTTENLLSDSLYTVSISNVCNDEGTYFSGELLTFSTTASQSTDIKKPNFNYFEFSERDSSLPINSSIEMIFDEEMSHLSAPVVKLDERVIEGKYEFYGNSIFFTPSRPFQYGKQYGVVLNESVADLVGNRVDPGFFSFTTESLPDTQSPKVLAISPSANAVDIETTETISLTFSEPMDLATVNSNNIALYIDNEIVRPEIFRSLDGQSINLTAPLPSGSLISVVTTDELADLNGNKAIPFVSSFTTSASDMEAVRPRVVRQIPLTGNRIRQNLNEIVLYFSAQMDESSIASALTVSQGRFALDGVLILESDLRTLRFIAEEPFPEKALIRVYLSSLAKDINGTAAYEYRSHFTMELEGELIGQPPVVSSSSFFYSGSKRPINPVLMVEFNEEINPDSLNPSTIRLRDRDNNVYIQANYSLGVNGKTLEVRPQYLLNANTNYEINIDNVVDTDGDTQETRFLRWFTTFESGVKDDRPPRVISSSPPHGATNVGRNALFAVLFDEPINPLSFNFSGVQRHNVFFNEENTSIRYQYTHALPSNAEITETISQVTDLAGNLVVESSSTFTTAIGFDFDSPVAQSSIPNKAKNIPVNTIMSWAFEEAIDPVSVFTGFLSPYIFDIATHEAIAVPVTASLSEDGRRLDVVPLQPLRVSREHSTSLRGSGLRDLSGNEVTSSIVRFTTSHEADLSPPQAISSTVVNGQNDVPTNVRLNIRFDEPLGLLAASKVSLTDSSDNTFVPHEVLFNSDHTVLTIRPIQLLKPDNTYVLDVSHVEDRAGNVVDSSYTISFTTGKSADFSNGAISKWRIPDNAENLPLNTELTVEFSEQVDITSITPESLYLSSGWDKFTGTWQLSLDRRTLTFLPENGLQVTRGYRLYVSQDSALTDLAGNPIEAGIRHFVTGEDIEDELPIALQVNIPNNAINIPANTVITLGADEVFPEQAGCSSQPFTLLMGNGSSIPVSHHLSSDSLQISIIPEVALKPSTRYSLLVNDLCDIAGNELNGEILSFTTAASKASDIISPQLLSMLPTGNTSDVPIDTVIEMEFNEPLSSLSRIKVVGRGLPVLGRHEINGNTLSFFPEFPLQAGVEYVVTLISVSDYAGNESDKKVTSFTTELVDDSPRPYVVTVSPENNAVDVSPSASIDLLFNEPMDAATVNSNNIAIYFDNKAIPPVIKRSVDGQRVNLFFPMPGASLVSVVVSDGVRDLDGNSVMPFVSSFTTGIRDLWRPTVTKQIPAKGTRDWFGVNEVVLHLSEPMDIASVEQAFHVAQDGVLVDGDLVIEQDHQTLRFTAYEPFKEGARVEVFLESLAKDQNGLHILNYHGYFVMGRSDEWEFADVSPAPQAYSFLNGQTGMPLNPLLSVRFNRGLDEALLSQSVIELWDRDNDVLLPTTANLDTKGVLLDIKPDGLLNANTQYELVLDGLIALNGAIGGRSTSRFITEVNAAEDSRRPTALLVSPPEGATDVGINAVYSIAFDEVMNPLSFDTYGGKRYDVLFNEDNTAVYYQRAGSLDAASEITETFSSVGDLAGNMMVERDTTFTTGAGHDFVSPKIESYITGGLSKAVISFQFDEPVDPVVEMFGSTVLFDTVLNEAVDATVRLSNDGLRLDLVPHEALAAGREYEYRIEHLRDLSGNFGKLEPWRSTSARFTTGFEDYTEDTLPPSVILTSILNGQTDVPRNVRLGIRFNELLSWVERPIVSLTDENNNVVPLRSGDNSLRILPIPMLEANTNYRIRIENIVDRSGNEASPFEISFTTGTHADISKGEISDWRIPPGSTNVPVDAQLAVGFSEKIDATSVHSSNFTLVEGVAKWMQEGLLGSWEISEDRRALTFLPSKPLEFDKQYTLVVRDNGIRDLAGNPIIGGQSVFSTARQSNFPPPLALEETNIPSGLDRVPTNAVIELLLNQPLPGWVGCSEQPFSLVSDGVEIPIQHHLSSDRLSVSIFPEIDLTPATHHSLYVSLCDYAGNKLEEEALVFTTDSNFAHDTLGPDIVDHLPSNDENNVPLNSSIEFEFDEPVSQLSRFNVIGEGLVVSGDYEITSHVIRFTPHNSLQPDTHYEIDLSSSVFDFSGNSRNHSMRSFRTEISQDEIPPSIVAMSPSNNAVDVGIHNTIDITFSKPVNVATLNNENISMYANGGKLGFSLSHSENGQYLKLFPRLPSDSLIRVEVTEGVNDLSGNSIFPFLGSFVTGGGADGDRPRVTKQIPRKASYHGFGLNEVVLYLSEPISESSVDQAFHVVQDGKVVEGNITVESDFRILRFRAFEAFSEGALVEVFLEDSVTDIAGNRVFPYQGHFTMRRNDERRGLAPEPEAYSPYDFQRNVPLNTEIQVRYNEELDEDLLSSAIIELWDRTDDISIPVGVSLAENGRRLDVQPLMLLDSSTRYELVLENVVDSDGDIQTQRYTTAFRTPGLGVKDIQRPTILRISPANNQTEVGTNVSYTVIFDEPVNPLSFDTYEGRYYNFRFSDKNTVVNFLPVGILPANSEITETISNVTDLAGNPVVERSTTFTTAAGPDFESPTAIGSIPDGAQDVPGNAIISWKFSEPIDPISITKFQYPHYLGYADTGLTPLFTVHLSDDGKRLEVVPNEPLLANQSYNYNLIGVWDMSGNYINNDHDLNKTFVTSSIRVDDIAPEVLMDSLDHGQTGMPTNAEFSLQFSEPLSVIEDPDIALVDAANNNLPYNMFFSNDYQTLRIAPSIILEANAYYEIILSEAQDRSGNLLEDNYELAFTTGDGPEVSDLVIQSWNFSHGDASVSSDFIPAVYLNHLVDSISLENNFYLFNHSTNENVAGSVEFDLENQKLSFTPDQPLPSQTEFTLHVREQLSNLTGKRLRSDFSRSFITR